MQLRRRISGVPRSKKASTGEKDVGRQYRDGTPAGTVDSGGAGAEEDVREGSRRMIGARVASPGHGQKMAQTGARRGREGKEGAAQMQPAPQEVSRGGEGAGQSSVSEKAPHGRGRSGIPLPGGGSRRGGSMGGGRGVVNGFRRASVGEAPGQKGANPSGGLLRLEGSQGWTASKWRGGGDKAQAEDHPGSADYQRSPAYAARMTPSPRFQANGGYQQQGERQVVPHRGGSFPSFGDEESLPSPGDRPDGMQLRLARADSAADQPDSHRGNTDSGGTAAGTPTQLQQQSPTQPQQQSRYLLQDSDEEAVSRESTMESSREGQDDGGTAPPASPASAAPPNANQEWIQLELDRLKTEFQFKNQIASMLRTTLADLKTQTQRGAGGYPQGGPMPGGQGPPPDQMPNGVVMPNGGPMMGPMPGQGGGMPQGGGQLPSPGMGHSSIPIPVGGMPQGGMQMPVGSPHAGVMHGGPGMHLGENQMSQSISNAGIPGPVSVGMQPSSPWQGGGYPGGYGGSIPGGDMGGRTLQHPLMSPTSSMRELSLAKEELEKKDKRINELMAELGQFNAHVKVLTKALEDERHDNAELTQENVLLRSQVERLASASAKLLSGMTAIQAV
eukprot:evm.model.scf_277.10 EVM.evm.TU.scf_277.10   scf_277:67178-72034(-)